jgi:hypothetical protein
VYAAEFSLSLSLCYLMLASTSIAKGQTVPLISGASELKASISDDTSWMYFPGVDGQTTVGFLASIDPSVAPRGSFTVVWFQRSAPGVYSMEGWTETSIEDAAAIIATRFDNPNLFQYADLEASPMSVTQQGQGLLTLPPEGTSNGIADGDPWQGVASALTPEDIAFLVDNGHATGALNLSGGGETISPCIDEYDAVSANLAQRAAMFEVMTFGTVSTTSTLPSALQCCSAEVAMVSARWCVSWFIVGGWSPPFVATISPGVAGCGYTRPISRVDACSTGWCGLGPVVTTTVPLTPQTRVCPTPANGTCPPTPPC